jgi:hypothetical protein
MANRGGGDWTEWSKHVLIEMQRLSDAQERMNDTLTENTKQLEIHIAGVKAAREQNELLRIELDHRVDIVEAEMAPLKSYIQTIQSVSMFVGKVLAVAGAIAGIIEAFLLHSKGP